MANMAKADFDKIVDLLKNDKTIGELNVLLGQGPNRDGTKLKDDGSIGYVHAIVLFTEGAFNGKQAEQYVQNCYVFSQYSTGSARGTVAQNACARINGTKSDMVIFNKLWKNYLIQNKYPPLTPTTKLKQVLVYIMGFLVKNYSSTVVGKDKPNADNFINFLANTCGVSAKGTTKMKDVATEKISDAIESSAKKCVIFTGAPGTGKTYCVEEYVKKAIKAFNEQFQADPFDRKEYFVQFHSSYDYTDFVEGLRPIRKDDSDDKKKDDSDDKKMDFVRMDGIFKAFCRKVVRLNGQYELKNQPVSQSSQNGSRGGGNTEDDLSESGVELPYCKKLDGKEQPHHLPYYYFVIDEINRADLGRVFGELMYCFEKRGEEHRIATQYTNLPAYGKDGTGKLVCFKGKNEKGEEIDCFKNGFYIPENVVIIGTMNDIDRSVETFDFALRRRFDWVELEADAVMESSLIAMGVPPDTVSDILHRIKAKENIDVNTLDGLNGEIAKQPGLGPEFKIGPAYFEDLKNYDISKTLKENLDPVWEHNIKPILREYMRGRQGAEDFIKNCGRALGVLSQDSDPEKDKTASDTQQPNNSAG